MPRRLKRPRRSRILRRRRPSSTAAVQTTPAPRPPTTIPLAEVAAQATAVSSFLATLPTQFPPSGEIEKIQKEFADYDAAPQKVIEVIESVAAAHPKVLKNPPPQALVTGFGDSSINFELRAWTDQYIGWNRIRSELAVAVYDAVHAAGFSFPFPQREVRLLQDNEA